MFLNSDQCDIKKIKEIMKVEEGKMKKFQDKLNDNLKKQEDKIQ